MKLPFNLLFLILVLGLTSACSKNVEKASEEMTATFYVDAIDGSSTVTKVDSLYSIPEERLYNFKVCLKDIMQSKSILGQEFEVSGDETNKIVSSDEQGCLNWSEEIAYNFLAPSTYIELDRKIVARGIHKGIKRVKLVINPWSHGDNTTGVIDPNKKSVIGVKAQGMSAFTAESDKAPLWALYPRVSISQQEFNGSGTGMNLKFQAKLALILKTTALQKIQYPLSNGAFNVEMLLYNSFKENGEVKNSLITSATLNNVGFTQDVLMADFPFNLTQLPNKGQILLGIKISPISNEINLDSFQTIYQISDNFNIKVDGTPIVNPNISFEAVKAELVKEEKINKIVNNSNIKPGLEVEKLDIRFFKVGSETTTDRQVFFNIKACIKNNLDRTPIKSEEFLVKTISNKAGIKLSTNLDGCLSFDDYVWHKVFANEKFIKSSITISNTNYNLNSQINVMINPWDNSSNFGRDTRFVDDLGSINVNPSNENVKVSIDNFSFSVQGYNYDINRNLDLSIIKKGVLALSAKMVNHASLSSGRNGKDSLRDGKYLLKWAVITLNQNENFDSLISNGQKVVDVYGGDLKTEVAFKITAFEKLNIRSKLVLALYTIKESKLKSGVIEIDKNSGLDATAHMGQIILNNDQEYEKMQMINNNLGLGKGDLFERIAAVGGTNSLVDYTPKILAAQNLKRINAADEKDSQALREALTNPTKYYTQKFNSAYYRESDLKPALDKQVLINFAKTGVLTNDLAQKFCVYWSNDFLRRMKPDNKDGVLTSTTSTVLTQQCMSAARSNPKTFFNVEKKLLIYKIGNFNYKSGTSTNFSVGNSFSVSKAESKSTSSTWSWNNSIGLSFEFLDLFKVGSTASYAISTSKSKSDTTSNSASVNASTYLFLQQSNFDITIDSYEECSSIKLNTELFSGRNAPLANIFNSNLKSQEIVKAATSGYFICTGVKNTTPITKRESYFYVSQDLSSKGEQDAYAAENHQFFMTFRGQKDLDGFLSLIQSSIQLPGSSTGFSSNVNGTKAGLMNKFGMLPTWPGSIADN